MNRRMRITHVAVAVIVWMKSVDLCWLDPTAAFASFSVFAPFEKPESSDLVKVIVLDLFSQNFPFFNAEY